MMHPTLATLLLKGVKNFPADVKSDGTEVVRSIGGGV